ncbi:MAG TPA: DUF2541 family protein [Ferruginibacter sp.]|nr:DUF2541 family protein [Ferruginibacter sp.]HRE63943.1 DUF2541 family protein [Ferruginibacter sp.]
MKAKLSIYLSALLLLFAVTTMSFKVGGWRSLGTKTVNYKLDRDVLDVQLRDGVFKQLKFVVRGGSLNMHKVVVHFENGGQQEINLRHNFERRSSSRIVDLKGNNRIIEKIVFWYDTQNSANNKARVTVLGK